MKPREMGKDRICAACWRRQLRTGRVGFIQGEVVYAALMKKAVQLDGEPSVSVSPGGLVITLHS